jgi:hypothetical protein
MSWPRACGSCSLRPPAVGTLARMPAPICLFRRKDRFCGRSGSRFRATGCLQRVDLARWQSCAGTSVFAHSSRPSWDDENPPLPRHSWPQGRASPPSGRPIVSTPARTARCRGPGGRLIGQRGSGAAASIVCDQRIEAKRLRLATGSRAQRPSAPHARATSTSVSGTPT